MDQGFIDFDLFAARVAKKWTENVCLGTHLLYTHVHTHTLSLSLCLSLTHTHTHILSACNECFTT